MVSLSDYLAEEVLIKQPTDTQNYATFNRLSSLCDWSSSLYYNYERSTFVYTFIYHIFVIAQILQPVSLDVLLYLSQLSRYHLCSTGFVEYLVELCSLLSEILQVVMKSQIGVDGNGT